MAFVLSAQLVEGIEIHRVGNAHENKIQKYRPPPPEEIKHEASWEQSKYDEKLNKELSWNGKGSCQGACNRPVIVGTCWCDNECERYHDWYDQRHSTQIHMYF